MEFFVLIQPELWPKKGAKIADPADVPLPRAYRRLPRFMRLLIFCVKQ
jgi:hypothetical protein